MCPSRTLGKHIFTAQHAYVTSIIADNLFKSIYPFELTINRLSNVCVHYITFQYKYLNSALPPPTHTFNTSQFHVKDELLSSLHLDIRNDTPVQYLYCTLTHICHQKYIFILNV